MNLLPDTGSEDTIYSVEGVRRLDRFAIETLGIPGYTLMTRAGEAAFAAARRRFPGLRRLCIVCGGGNNAGDGFVVGRAAAEAGLELRLVSIGDPDSLRGDARTARDGFLAAGGRIRRWPDAFDEDAGIDLLVDAMLGSGIDRPVEGAYAAAVDAINAHPAPVLALDLPSGLNGDSGEIMGRAVNADLTVTFVGLKTGLFLGAGPELCGVVELAALGVSADRSAGIDPVLHRLPDASRRLAFAPRSRIAHKGAFGHVLIIGGGPGMPGAVRLAGEAALRSGAGLVSVATHPAHHAEVAAARPELMVHAAEDPSSLDDLLSRASVVAVGPGLGRSDWSRALFDAALDAGGPLVIDADGLNLLAERPVPVDGAVLTPHPGEAARLLSGEAADIQRDRIAALRSLVERYRATVVLKGAGTLAGDGASIPWICTRGNPGMASPGMGDALTGIIAALRAQAFSALAAAVYGVDLHARAGDRAAGQGERGMLASDLLAELRDLVNPAS